MATSSDASVSFDESDTRSEEMHSTIEAWVDELVDVVDRETLSTRVTELRETVSPFQAVRGWIRSRGGVMDRLPC